MVKQADILLLGAVGIGLLALAGGRRTDSNEPVTWGSVGSGRAGSDYLFDPAKIADFVNEFASDEITPGGVASKQVIPGGDSGPVLRDSFSYQPPDNLKGSETIPGATDLDTVPTRTQVYKGAAAEAFQEAVNEKWDRDNRRDDDDDDIKPSRVGRMTPAQVDKAFESEPVSPSDIRQAVRDYQSTITEENLSPHQQTSGSYDGSDVLTKQGTGKRYKVAQGVPYEDYKTWDERIGRNIYGGRGNVL